MANNKTRANDGFSAPKKKNIKKGKESNAGAIIPLVCMVLVIALFAGVIAATKVIDSGIFYRNTVSVSSENYKVSNSMLQYYFNSQYQNYYSTLQQSGIDLTKSLKDAQFSKDKSWFDYLMQDLTIPQVESMLVLCEAAKADKDFKMDEHDLSHIEDNIKSLKENAKSNGVSVEYYIRSVFGYGINLDDIRDAMELQQIANAYQEYMTESYEFTEEEWDKYLKDNKSDFEVIDYVSYTFDAANFKTEEDKTATTTTTAKSGSSSDSETTTTAKAEDKKDELSQDKKDAKTAAETLYNYLISPDSTNALADFKDGVKKHLEDIVYASTTDADKKAESVETALAGITTEAASRNDSDEFLKFAFSKDRGDKVEYITKDDTNGKYTVYVITKAPYIQEYVTKNVRVLALSVADSTEKLSDKVDAAVEDFEKTDKTEKDFVELINKYNPDAHEHDNDYVYENISKNFFGVDELDTWLFGNDGKAGAYKYASNGQTGTSEVVYLVYVVGDGLIKWQSDVDSTLTSEAYSEDYEALSETHKLDVDLKEAYKIPSQAGVA